MVMELRTYSQEKCYLCHTTGHVLHHDLHDYLFGVTGQWHLKRCDNQACGLVWLDPMPFAEELHKAYQSYYTHHADTDHDLSFMQKLDRAVYRRCNRLFARLSGLASQQAQSQHLFIPPEKTGTLLDIGCGNGRFLKRMADKGWSVVGTDFDKEAVEYVKNTYQFEAYIGDLVDLPLSPQRFDIITLQHVIEHVPNPVELLNHCKTLLKPQGKIILVTPNVQSWGHQYYQQHWRGLEPPRHVYLYAPKTLEALTQQAGLHTTDLRTTATGAEYILKHSRIIEKHSRQQPIKNQFFFSVAWLQQYYALWKLHNNPLCGEEIYLTVEQ